MSVIIRGLIGLVSALLATWLLLVVVLLLMRPRGEHTHRLTRFLPKVVRLLRDLYHDPAVPRRARWRLWTAFMYNIQPFTIIPDFVPVIGFVDNVIVTIWALRGAVRTAGPAVVARRWKGSDDELALLFKIARLGDPPAPGPVPGG